MGWKVMHIDGEQIWRTRPISESWTEIHKERSIKRMESIKKRWTKLRFGQEVNALFLEDLQQYFPDDLIERAMTETRPTSPTKTGTNFMGNDLARMGGDQFSAEILNKSEHEQSPLIHVENITMTELLTTQNEREILSLDLIWNPLKIGIDAGAGTLGVSVLDHLRETDIGYKVVAMNNRTITIDGDGKTQRIFMEDMYENLKGMMERQEIRLLNDPEIRASLKSVQWETSNDPKKISKTRIFSTFGHIVEGLNRAAWLAKETKNLNIQIHWV